VAQGITNGDDDALDRLVREAAAPLREEPAARPDDAAILSYLGGAASAEQRVQVHAHLLASSAFRREMAEAIMDIEALASPQARAAFDAQVIHADVSSPGIFDRVRELFAPRRWALALATASVVFIAFMVSQRSRSPENDWALAVPTRVDWAPENFAPFDLRGERGHEAVFGGTAEEAALLALRQGVAWEDGKLVWREARSDRALSGATVEICFRDESRRCRATARAQVPADAPTSSLIGFFAIQRDSSSQNLQVHECSIAESRVAVDVPLSAGDRVLVTVVYPVEGGYSASPPVRIEAVSGR
jgi:hypothetical protein